MGSSDTIIQVDTQAAELLRRASQRAQAMGETLGAYLSHVLPADETDHHGAASQRMAWKAFVSGMTAWSSSHLPAGYVADDSRDAIYDDRS
jgi:hypothetical protein